VLNTVRTKKQKQKKSPKKIGIQDKHPRYTTLLLRRHCRYLSRAEHVVNGGNGGGRLLLCDGEILLGGAAYHPARHPSKYDNQYDKSSVADPDPNDPYVFGPPGSISQIYGSGSFYHQAKIARKKLIPFVL
jgi:hypothetical protein